MRIFKVDWLHAVDQGVGATTLGCLFTLLTKVLPGARKCDRVGSLRAAMNQFYDAKGITDRIPSFNENSFKGSKSSGPKLRCSAACCRSLIPFGDEMAKLHLADDDPEQSAAKWAIHHLHACYSSLRSDAIFPREALAYHGPRFAQQLIALEACYGGARWSVKPKLHLFMHLCESDGRPAMHWCYRDEDYGGSIAQMAHPRGRWDRVGAYSRRVLELFQIRHEVPRVV